MTDRKMHLSHDITAEDAEPDILDTGMTITFRARLATTFDVTAGDGNDVGTISYLAMGLGATPQTGALDVDFFGWAPGLLLPTTAGGEPPLQPGDADMDYKFDQLDLVRVQVAAKYLTGQPATWGEGDWNGGPGGSAGNPPVGDNQFNQLDIIAALNAGKYLTGPYGAVNRGGMSGDEQTSIVYNPSTGEIAVDAPASTELTSINIDSAAYLSKPRLQALGLCRGGLAVWWFRECGCRQRWFPLGLQDSLCANRIVEPRPFF